MLKGAIVLCLAPTAPLFYLEDELWVVALFIQYAAQHEAELQEALHLTTLYRRTKLILAV